MTTNALTERNQVSAELLEKVVIEGDLEKLSPGERLTYYSKVCESLGLNPLTQPFAYIKLSGKLRLYATKDATEQLARQHGISLRLGDGKVVDDIYVVRATASTPERSADATGAVPLGTLKGEAKANALMKAETKASRRAVLRLVGMGWLDESEVAAVPEAVPVMVDQETGEIVGQALPETQNPSPKPQEGAPSQGRHHHSQALRDLAKAGRTAGMSGEDITSMSNNRYGVGPRELNLEQLNEFIEALSHVPVLTKEVSNGD